MLVLVCDLQNVPVLSDPEAVTAALSLLPWPRERLLLLLLPSPETLPVSADWTAELGRLGIAVLTLPAGHPHLADDRGTCALSARLRTLLPDAARLVGYVPEPCLLHGDPLLTLLRALCEAPSQAYAGVCGTRPDGTSTQPLWLFRRDAWDGMLREERFPAAEEARAKWEVPIPSRCDPGQPFLPRAAPEYPAAPFIGSTYKRLSVVLALYGQRKLTERCLKTLRHDLAGDPWRRPAELICVDNASPDDTQEWLTTQADVLTLSLAENYGCAGGWNRGLRAASGDVLCVLNNDTEILPGGMRALAQAAWECGIAAFSGGMLDDRILYAGSTTDRALSDYPEGTALAFRRDVWATVGPFDEGMRFGYGEDSDWGLRARALGFSWAILPGILIHLGSRTAPHVPGLAESYEQNQRRLEARWRDHLPPRPGTETTCAAAP